MLGKEEERQRPHREAIQRRTAVLGVNREYVDALERAYDHARKTLANARDENERLKGEVESARLALTDTAGWSQRLPYAVSELTALAAGDYDHDAPGGTLAEAIMGLIGEELLASVEVTAGEADGQLQAETTFNDNERPVATSVRLGECAVQCTWQPGAQAGADTARIVEGLCAAVVCSLAAVTSARSRRDPVTQLADERSLKRHLALRERTNRPATLVHVAVDEQCATGHRELYGRLAWSAALAEAAAALERIATANGGAAYQTGALAFDLLLDPARAEHAREQAEAMLAEHDDLSFQVTVGDP